MRDRSFPSSIQQGFDEHLLDAGHCSRHWRYSSEHNKSSHLCGAYILVPSCRVHSSVYKTSGVSVPCSVPSCRCLRLESQYLLSRPDSPPTSSPFLVHRTHCQGSMLLKHSSDFFTYLKKNKSLKGFYTLTSIAYQIKSSPLSLSLQVLRDLALTHFWNVILRLFPFMDSLFSATPSQLVNSLPPLLSLPTSAYFSTGKWCELPSNKPSICLQEHTFLYKHNPRIFCGWYRGYVCPCFVCVCVSDYLFFQNGLHFLHKDFPTQQFFMEFHLSHLTWF